MIDVNHGYAIFGDRITVRCSLFFFFFFQFRSHLDEQSRHLWCLFTPSRFLPEPEWRALESMKSPFVFTTSSFGFTSFEIHSICMHSTPDHLTRWVPLTPILD
jgi:hypothetical protein